MSIKISLTIIVMILGIAATGLVTALSSVAAPAHAKINNCPTGDLCTAGGFGQQGGGIGSREVFNSNTDTITISGGQGHVGGGHATSGPSGITCVGSACP